MRVFDQKRAEYGERTANPPPPSPGVEYPAIHCPPNYTLHNGAPSQLPVEMTCCTLKTVGVELPRALFLPCLHKAPLLERHGHELKPQPKYAPTLIRSPKHTCPALPSRPQIRCMVFQLQRIDWNKDNQRSCSHSNGQSTRTVNEHSFKMTVFRKLALRSSVSNGASG